MINKKEFIEKFVANRKVSKAEAITSVNNFLLTLEESITDNGGVKFVGLFSAEVVNTSERKGVDPRTKEPLVIKAGKRVKFSTGKSLKRKLN